MTTERVVLLVVRAIFLLTLIAFVGVPLLDWSGHHSETIGNLASAGLGGLLTYLVKTDSQSGTASVVSSSVIKTTDTPAPDPVPPPGATK